MDEVPDLCPLRLHIFLALLLFKYRNRIDPFCLILSRSLYHQWSARGEFNQAKKGHRYIQKTITNTILTINMKNMKNTRRMRKLLFSYSTPLDNPIRNIEPNITSDLFCHALHLIFIDVMRLFGFRRNNRILCAELR